MIAAAALQAVLLQGTQATLPSPSPTPAFGANVITVSFLCSFVIWAPVGAAALIGLLPNPRQRYDRAFLWIAFWANAGLLVICFLAYTGFQTFGTTLQFEEKLAWLPALGVTYHLGLDAVGMCTLLLTTIVGTLAVVASWNVRTRVREYFCLFLLLEAAVNGVVCAHDAFVLALFLSAALVPAGLLLLGWTEVGGERSALRLLAYWGLGAGAIWAAVLILYAATGGAGFDLDTLGKAHLALPAQMAVGVAVLIGGACWLGVAPLHGGVRSALADAPTGVAVLIAGSVSRLGAFLLLRLLLVPEAGAASKLGSALAGLAVATALYSGILALGELRASGDVRRLGALLGLLPGAVTLLAVAGQTPLAFDGAIFAIFAGGLAAALLVGALATAADRAETRSLLGVGGAGVRAPVLTWLLVLAALGLLGFPGFGSYLAWLMTLFGSIRNEPGGTFGVLAGLVLAGVAFSILLWRVAFGAAPADAQPVPEATIPERWYLAGLAVALIWVGVVPSGPKVAGAPILDPGFVNVVNASTSDQAAPYQVPVPKPH